MRNTINNSINFYHIIVYILLISNLLTLFHFLFLLNQFLLIFSFSHFFEQTKQENLLKLSTIKVIKYIKLYLLYYIKYFK